MNFNILNKIKNIITSVAANTQMVILKNYQAGTFLNPVEGNNALEQFEHWTYKAIDIKAKACTGVELRHVDNGQVVENSQIIKDLQRFNSFLGFEQAIYLLIAHLSLTGSAFWYIKKAESIGYKFSFIPLDPTRVKIRLNSEGIPNGYSYTDIKNQKTELDTNEVIAFILPNPTNWVKSYSTLQATKYAHNIIELAMRYNQNLFSNMGALSGFLVFDGITQEERAIIEEKIKEKFTGTRNAGKIGVVNKKFDWVELSKTPKELNFKEAFIIMRDTILSLHGIPKDLVIGGSTYENAKEAQRIFQTYTIKPLLNLIENALNRQLLPLYNAGGFLRFDNPIVADKKQENDIIIAQYGAGLISRKEARALLGYSKTEPPEDEDTKEKKSINKITDREKIRSKMARLSRKVERFTSKKIKNYFINQLNKLINTKKSAINVLERIDWETENRELVGVLQEITQYILMVYADHARQVLDDDNLKFNPNLLASLIDQNVKNAYEINETTRKELAELIAESIKQGDGIQEMTEKIKELYKNYTSKRMETIARTESTRIRGGALRDLYAQSDKVEAFEWITARDDFTRRAHLEADGQRTKKGGKFLVGGDLLAYPGDPKGKPSNIINCRCDIVPVLKIDKD